MSFPFADLFITRSRYESMRKENLFQLIKGIKQGHIFYQNGIQKGTRGGASLYKTI